VMVCDGFIGNIFLKTAEGVADAVIHVIREEFRRDPVAGMAAKLLQRAALRQVRERLSFEQFGGAPLLGLNGNVVICHGRSTAKAIAKALEVGYKLAQSDIAHNVAQYIESHWTK
jgi:glycerol-3-phosphate acyltransferase PlsX